MELFWKAQFGNLLDLAESGVPPEMPSMAPGAALVGANTAARDDLGLERMGVVSQIFSSYFKVDYKEGLHLFHLFIFLEPLNAR